MLAKIYLLMLPVFVVTKSSKTLLNCTTGSEWTQWSSWSSCEWNLLKRRQRHCKDTSGTTCIGENVQTRKCKKAASQHMKQLTTSLDAAPPEYVWGLWSEWNEWGMCSCPANHRQRSRHCLGQECSGCNEEYGDCERRCVTERWWSDWSEWVSGHPNVRFRSWCSLGADGRSLITTLLNESATTTESVDQWSEWNIRPGVAFRYRQTQNYTTPTYSEKPIDIQYQLLANTSSTHVTLAFCLYLNILTLISGFIAQCLVSKLFSCCRTSTISYL